MRRAGTQARESGPEKESGGRRFMGEERLLERIRTWRNEPKRRSRGEVSRQIDSIVAHLQRILNTRQGNVPIADGYGVPDLTDFMLSYPESVTEIEKSLRQAIEEYEPRLTSVRVSFVHQEDDLLCLRFQIVAQLRTESGRNVLIETIVDSDGKVSLKG